MSGSIPLHCSICPKKPDFSDVSHLLTHVASKGHLSSYYKAKVRASSDEDSRQAIEQFDRWYAQWDVEGLMSERLHQKDKRRSRLRSTVRPTPPTKIEAPLPRLGRARAAVSDLLDPRLSEAQYIKIEHGTTPTPTPRPGPILRNRTFPAHMQYWPADSRASSLSFTNVDNDSSSDYSDPLERKRRRALLEDTCAVEDDPVDSVVVDSTAVSESTKLKGIYWPGMDIFDSATPEMRRKRNQKKDSSVVEQLALHSLEVEATELIFTPQGSFKRQRRISSSVFDEDEDEQIKLESPKKRPPRPVLAELDVNSIYRPRQLQSRRPQVLLPGSGIGNEYYSSVYGDGPHKRKRAFGVYQETEASFAHPAAFNYLTAGLQQQLSPSPVSMLSAYKNYNPEVDLDNKENMLPAMHPPVFEPHPHYPQSAFLYGLSGGLHGEQHYGFPFHGHAHGSSAFQQESPEEDDQRTITAPPSPSIN